MNLQEEPPEKKKTKTSSSSPSLSLIPDEILVNCLARISRSNYPTLSLVSKTFCSILSSTELYAARAHLGTTEQCLYVCLWDLGSYRFPHWFTLWTNPNRTLPDSMIRRRRKKKTAGQLLVPISSFNFPSVATATAVVGSEIYVFGGPVGYEPSSEVRVLDCRSNTWRDAPSMNAARKFAPTCVYGEKIYVMGGCQGSEKNESWAEVFDTKTQTWERLTDPGDEIRKCRISRIREIEGKIKFGNVERKMYGYDTKQCKWENCVNESAIYARLECIMENVSYGFWNKRLLWYDIINGYWKGVRGLESLLGMYMRNGGSRGNKTKLVCCGGKFLLIWEGYMNRDPNNRKKIWCAEIVIEERNDGIERWGIVERVDVLRTVPRLCQLLHCLVVSV
ncbi:PREDICTED: F-box/kelch-repeat protein At4g19865-like [Camelina sativa]|uniref:F-box/kelch-repeat protein At4g19865-like n=1 Tax=Camelina sativa TaxID=90675 RepID=A0ABM0U190_CAMSA|nr:PREDICTED: F-box/kelch-repeat protein At4g19865-like [Camelina sativa]